MNKLELLRKSHFNQKKPMKYDIPDELKERCKKVHVLLDWKQCPANPPKDNDISECRFVLKPPEALIIECEQRENKKVIYYYKDEPEFKTIQKIVGGYFTIIPLENNKIMFVNEEGELKKLKINKKATEIIGFNIYGIVIIVG